MTTWVRACAVEDLEAEDLITVELNGSLYAIYQNPDGSFFATDGLCTHQNVSLADGFVMDHVIECPKHNGQFDYRTGKGLCTPITRDLTCYPTKVEAGEVQVQLPPKP